MAQVATAARLWKVAFQRLEAGDAELLRENEQQRADLNNTLIDKALYDEKAKQWCIQLAGKSLRIRELGGQIVRFISDSQDFLQQVTSMEPHAATAWTCVSLLLPVSSHPSSIQSLHKNLFALVRPRRNCVLCSRASNYPHLPSCTITLAISALSII